jgi:ParB family chromosome partitioning protein
MSERVGKKRSTIANYLRLLKLDPIIQTGIRDGFISMGHGRAIINIEDLDVQTDIYQKIVSQNLSVRETETLVKNYHESLKPKAEQKPKSDSSFIVRETQKNSFNDYFGSKVDIKVAGNGKGKITIPFSSEADFNRIIKLING